MIASFQYVQILFHKQSSYQIFVVFSFAVIVHLPLGLLLCKRIDIFEIRNVDTSKRVTYNYNFAVGLINELLAAQQEYRLNKVEKQWLASHVVILDELGYIPFSKIGAELLFQFCSARYERGSLIITSNLEFPKWTEVLGDEQMTAALLDRLTHNAHILNINGESFRFKQALAKQTDNG